MSELFPKYCFNFPPFLSFTRQLVTRTHIFPLEFEKKNSKKKKVKIVMGAASL